MEAEADVTLAMVPRQRACACTISEAIPMWLSVELAKHSRISRSERNNVPP